jgi:isoleucyl-tRNA synthetase
MLYKKVSTDLNFVEREKEVLAFWKQNEIFKKSVEQSKGKEPFTFYDGPPTANGKPHIGHILTRCIKDLIPRYQTMKGKDVLRKAGWDTHGLPVELEVEKQLGLDGKDQIEAYGVEDFITKCKESVWTYKGEWERMSDRVGFWADMEDPYVTYEDNYIESVWWSIKQISEKDLLYKGHKVVPYCPRCGTSLSSHEVAQGYKDIKETSIFVRFEVKNQENTFLLAWTTTPWTLPSNVGLCVNPVEHYVKVQKDGQYLILAKNLCETLLGEDYTIIENYVGKDLEHMEYVPLYDFGVVDKKAWFVTCDGYVTLSDGTGIVHIAPAFGEDDARVGRKYNLPFVQMVDEKGEFIAVTPWAGVFVKDADAPIMKDLADRDLLFDDKEYEHSYPFCWRCDTPLIYYARKSWFIAMTKVRDLLQQNNRNVNWLPENIKEGRMGNFIENVIDWGLSRERYWGTPLPVWECQCGNFHVIGSKQELKKMSDDCPDEIELHKPYIDAVHLNCPECGEKMTRVSEVIDCWYDSGSMPFAQWHYPFENKEMFDKRFPANFISEAVDQTRGWFYTLLAIGTCVFEKNPFENCIVLGHVQDQDGQKMSKHKGNVVDPWTVLDNQGADAVRWYFYSNSNPWLPNRFNFDAVSESQRKYMGTLWNTYAFYILYADIDGFDPTKYTLDIDKLSAMDKWVLSKLNTLVKNVSGYLDNYKLTEPARELNKFVDQLSNWYVRNGRQRYWGKEMTQDKINAYMTLYTVIETVAKVTAPFTPFMAEAIYQNIVRSVDTDAPLSIHLSDFPVVDEALIDSELEDHMDRVLDIVVLGRAVRNKAAIKNRQPIGDMYVSGDTLPDMFMDIIKSELNVKAVSFGVDMTAFMSYSVKPQLRTMGPKYGKQLGAIREYLANVDGNMIVDAVADGKEFTFEAGDASITVTEQDLLTEPAQKPGFASDSDGDLSVVLDTNLTEQLISEGYIRELTSKIQTMRKDAGFEVTDHIRLFISSKADLMTVVNDNKSKIMNEVLADEFLEEKPDGFEKEWNINGKKSTIVVLKV